METGQRPNKRLRLQRRLRGWSQEDVAAGLHRLAASLGEPELGVDATMISRWERGMRKPRPRYVRLLCTLFELPAEELGILEDTDLELLPEPPQRPEGDDDEARRRDFISQVATLLGVAALPPAFEPAGGPEPWERLTQALNRTAGVDAATVEHLEQVTAALESLGPTQVGPRALLGPVTGHLDAIALLLHGSLAPGLRRRLCSLAGETAAFAGWLRWNMDDQRGAAAYFRAGLQAAQEAGDRALAMYLVGSAACQPPYREDPAERIRRLAAGPGGLSATDASPSTQVWLAAKAADAYAQMGRADDCLRTLDRATALLQRTRVEGEGRRPRFTVVDATWLAGERGASLAKLGFARAALEALRPVLASLGPTSERDRLWLTLSLASAYLQDGEPEEARRLAQLALTGAARIHLHPVVKMVRRLGVLEEGEEGEEPKPSKRPLIRAG